MGTKARPNPGCMNFPLESNNQCLKESSGINAETASMMAHSNRSGITIDEVFAVFVFMKNGANYSTTSIIMKQWYPGGNWGLTSTKAMINNTAKLLVQGLEKEFLSPTNDRMMKPFDASPYLKPTEQILIDTVPVNVSTKLQTLLSHS